MTQTLDRDPPDLAFRAGEVAHLCLLRHEPGLYGYQVMNGSELLYEEHGFESICSALSAAADVDGPLVGFTVMYRGLAVGSYRSDVIVRSAAEVANRAVETVAQFSE